MQCRQYIYIYNIAIDRMKEKEMKQTSLRIDEQTDRNLAILRDELNSPKTWIIRRLVADELRKVQTKGVVKQ